MHLVPRLAATAAATAAAAIALAPVAGGTPPESPAPHADGAQPPGAAERSDAVRPADATPPVDTNCAPDYGLQKLRVGVQLKSGAWVPAGSSMAGSTLQISESGPCSGLLGNDKTWTCIAGDDGRCPDVTVGDGLAWLSEEIGGQPVGSTPYTGPRPNLLLPGDTATITQIAGPTDHSTDIDPEPHTVGPCRPTSATVTGIDCGIAGPDQWPVGALPGAFKSTARAAGVRRDAAAADCSPAADGSTICLTYTPVIAIAPGWPPVAHDDTATTRRGTAVKIPVLGNDETHGAPATLAVADPGHGSAAVDSGRVRYIPAPGFTGRDTFRYTLTTANGSSTATVSVEVTAPPQAQDDAATTAAGHAVTIDVLANDEQGTSGPLTITTVGAPAHGSATVAGGQVNYEPADGWSGTDRFTYSVRDQDGGRSSATVVVRVTAPAAPASPSAPTRPSTPGGTGPDALSDTGFGAAAGGGAGLAAVALGVVLTACGRRRRGRRA